MRGANTINRDTFVKAIVPDGGWGWIVCISCFFGNITVGGIMLSFGIILPSIKRFYDEGTFAISLVGSFMVGVTYGSAPLAAFLANRIGLRAVYMIGSLIAFISFFASAFSSNAYLLIFFFGIMGGTGLGLVLMPASVACNLYFERKRILATVIAKTGFSIGGFILPLLTFSILEDFRWRGVVWVYGIIAFISCLFGSFVKPLELVFTENPDKCKDVSGSLGDTKTVKKDLPCINNTSKSPIPNISIVDTEGTNVISPNISNQDTASTNYSRMPQMQRRLSIMQLENMKEDMKKEDVKNTEFVFKPNAPEGSKLFLPPAARFDSFYDGSLANLFGPASSTRRTSDVVDAHSGETYSVVSMSFFDHNLRDTTLKDKMVELAEAISWENLPIFMLFLSRFFGNFSMTIFFIELPSILLHNGFSLRQASVVLTIIGVANSISRVVIGTIIDHPNVNSCFLTGAGFVLQAIVLCVIPLTFPNHYTYLLVFGAIIGITNSPYWVGLSIALGRMLPLKKIASTSGLISIAQGLGSIVGPPVAGIVFDVTKNYSLTLYITAIGYVLSGIFCCLAAYIHDK